MGKKRNQEALYQFSEEPAGPSGTTFVLGGVIGALGYGLYQFYQWWVRDEDGPTGRGGIGFGKGNGSGINLNPLDKGKAQTGDDEGELDGAAWERAEIGGVQGWQRKGIPVPDLGDGMLQAVLILGDGETIPDAAGWPDNLPAFLVHDRFGAYPETPGGWFIDATLGARGAPAGRTLTCRAATPDELNACIAAELAKGEGGDNDEEGLPPCTRFVVTPKVADQVFDFLAALMPARSPSPDPADAGYSTEDMRRYYCNVAIDRAARLMGVTLPDEACAIDEPSQLALLGRIEAHYDSLHGERS